jgi:hypothetical protein
MLPDTIPSDFSFVVKRSEWYRGKFGSRLLRPDGFKCCVGFCMLALGFSEDAIRHIPTAGSIDSALADELERKILTGAGMGHIYAINDNPNISNEEREGFLTEAFKDIGITVTFIN